MIATQTAHLCRLLVLLSLAGGALGKTPIEKLKEMRIEIEAMEKNIRSIYDVSNTREAFFKKYKEFDQKWDQRLRMFKAALFHQSAVYKNFTYIIDKFERVNPQGNNAFTRCVLLDAFYTEIENRDQHRFIKTFLAEHTFGINEYAYVGGYQYDGDWYGPVLNYMIVAFWAPYYPSDAEGENCLCLDRRLDWDLTNVFCNDRRSRSLCEMYDDNPLI